MKQWGSVNHQMAVPVPSISCCIFNNNDFFYQDPNELAFNRDTCCHLVICLWLIASHLEHQSRVVNGTTGFTNVNNYFNQHLLLPRDIWWSKFNLYLNVVRFFNTTIIRHLWQIKTVVFLHCCLIHAALLQSCRCHLTIYFCAIGFFFGRSSDWQKVRLNTDLLKHKHGHLYRKEWRD